MIISINTEKAFDKFKPTFMMKTLSKLGILGKFLKQINAIMKGKRAIYEKSTDNILNG